MHFPSESADYNNPGPVTDVVRQQAPRRCGQFSLPCTSQRLPFINIILARNLIQPEDHDHSFANKRHNHINDIIH
jgi:hypothetical protein